MPAVPIVGIMINTALGGYADVHVLEMLDQPRIFVANNTLHIIYKCVP